MQLNEPTAYRNRTVSAWLAAEDYEISSVDTSAYSQARKRLPEKMLQRLFGQHILADHPELTESKTNVLEVISHLKLSLRAKNANC